MVHYGIWNLCIVGLWIGSIHYPILACLGDYITPLTICKASRQREYIILWSLLSKIESDWIQLFVVFVDWSMLVWLMPQSLMATANCYHLGQLSMQCYFHCVFGPVPFRSWGREGGKLGKVRHNLRISSFESTRFSSGFYPISSILPEVKYLKMGKNLIFID